MNNFLRTLVRSSSFLRKEIFETIRQPRLVFTLILGPFLILLIFGIGYKAEARALRTIFVAEPGSPIAAQIEEFATSLGPQLIFEGVISDRAGAIARLRRGEVDLVAIAPEDAYETIRSNQKAEFTLYHYEIDPFQHDYVNYFGQVYVDEVNRRILRAVTEQGQQDASGLQEDIRTARENARAMRAALEAGDAIAAQQNQTELNRNVDSISLAVGASLGLLGSVQQTLGPGDEGEAGEILAALNNVQQNSDNLNDSSSLAETGGTSGGDPEEIQKLDQVDADLATLEEKLAEFQSISPDILVSPFSSKTESIALVQPSPSEYFAPSVLALLLQHLAVTFAALSIVRERLVGTMELFRVSPLSAMEALLGKYLSYLIFGGLIAAGLTALLVYVLRVPMFGNWWYYVLVVAALLFTSLGIGFIISIISQTDSQAVQYSMIILLASVFFMGFLMPLSALIPPVRVVSWMLPATYGSILLRDIMLRGGPPVPLLLGGLAAIGAGLFLLAWLLLRRLISSSQR
jgi:ABC-2 type transport system permease protein